MPSRVQTPGLSRLLALLLAALFFSWGYFSRRNQVFPHGIFRQIRATLMAQPQRFSVEPEASVQIDLLNSIGYLRSAPDPHGRDSGVLIYDEARVFKGYTLYSPWPETHAYLINMHGQTVWEWNGPEESDGWQHVELLDDGGLLLIVKERFVERIDEDSNQIWRQEIAAHHDLWVFGKEVWVLTRASRLVPAVHRSSPVLADKITVLDLATGSFIREIDVLDILMQSAYRSLLPSVDDRAFPDNAQLDLLHTNHVEVFDGSQVSHSPLFRRGNLLLSMRQISSIAIVDPIKTSVEWLWGPSNLTFQHHPTLTDASTILLFNNGVKQSEVIELDPESYRIVWRYSAPGFFSKTRGSVQRLPNGNTLITETDTGHAFEVTASGERVWEFANPHVYKDGDRAAVWRATRFSKEELHFRFEPVSTPGATQEPQ